MTASSDGPTTYYLAKDGQTYGPHSVTEIESFIESGAIQPDHLLWAEGMEAWVSIGELLRAQEPPSGTPAEPDEVPHFMESWYVARIEPGSFNRRVGTAATVAILFHLGLLVTLTVGAGTFFKLRSEAPAAAPPEPPPMEVALVTEDDPPPEPQTPPPPPPDDPPPPPALPDIPIPTVMQPPVPTPVSMPDPVEAPVLPQEHVAMVASPSPLPHPMRQRKPSPVAPTAPPGEASDASPSDYLDAPPPNYPYQARAQHEEGTVILLVMINDAGEPVSVSVAESSGYPVLDEVARRQVANYFKFRVGSSRALRVPINFHL